MNMRKLLAVSLAAVTALSMNVAAFADTAPAPAPMATGSKTFNLTQITGQPVLDDGAQVSSVGSTATPNDSIAPNQAVYFTLPASVAKMVGSTANYKLSSKKVTNSKYIKSIKIVEKKLTSSGKTILVPNVENANLPPVAPSTSNYDAFNSANRNTYIEVLLNDTTSADEFKVQFSVTLTARKPVDLTYGNTNTTTPMARLAANDKLTLNGTFYVANKTDDGGDTSISVGSKGVTIKPIGNEDNEVIFETDEVMATLRYRANSNPAKFYASLSTKWTSDLLAKFKNTDAVIRKFSPVTVDSTSRATVSFNNPFDDSVDPSDVYIYSVSSKGVLTDVSKNFTYNADDDEFTIRTRTLGTWVISDGKVSTK